MASSFSSETEVHSKISCSHATGRADSGVAAATRLTCPIRGSPVGCSWPRCSSLASSWARARFTGARVSRNTQSATSCPDRLAVRHGLHKSGPSLPGTRRSGSAARTDEEADRQHRNSPRAGKDEHDDDGQHRAQAREADAEPEPPCAALEDEHAGDDLPEPTSSQNQPRRSGRFRTAPCWPGRRSCRRLRARRSRSACCSRPRSPPSLRRT